MFNRCRAVRVVFDVALMLRVPLRPRPSHVMKLGPIGFAGNFDQPEDDLIFPHENALRSIVRAWASVDGDVG